MLILSRRLPLVLLLALAIVPPAPAAAQARLSPEECRRITAHVPDASVAFQPGVGAGGRRVAPADLAPPPRILPEVPAIALGVDLGRRQGLRPEIQPGIEAELPIGILTFEGNRLLLNGRPLSAGEEAALAAACAAARPR